MLVAGDRRLLWPIVIALYLIVLGELVWLIQ